MTKKTYKIEGTNFTRTTERDYSYAVVGVNWWGEFKSVGYSSSYELAQKTASREQGSYQKPLEIRKVERIK